MLFWEKGVTTFSPEALQKVSKHFKMTFSWPREASPKRSRSSMKNKWHIGGPVLVKWTGFQLFASTSCWISCPSLSIASTKRYGERGSPCRMPRVGWKASVFPHEKDLHLSWSHTMMYQISELFRQTNILQGIHHKNPTQDGHMPSLSQP